MTCVRVLVADDQKVVRDGLRLMLGMLGLLGIEVISGAVGGTDAARQAVAVAPGVVLMDLHMPDRDGAEATRLIVDKQPHVRVMVLTAFSDCDPVFGEAQLDLSVQRRQAGAMVRGEHLGVPAASQAGSAPEMRNLPAISALDRPAAISMSTSTSRWVSPSGAEPTCQAAGTPARSPLTMAPASLRCTDGSSWASPARAAGIACRTSPASLVRKPRAPARSAATTGSSSENPVSTTTRTSGGWRTIRRVAWTPSQSGM